ncbi:MAG: hypothetical protein M0D55_00180 [Elusimicrobiota bacterium]|nr:MAG: hypothetical protein M0D55_00180 [Elusimicrobiota bacterium]
MGTARNSVKVEEEVLSPRRTSLPHMRRAVSPRCRRAAAERTGTVRGVSSSLGSRPKETLTSTMTASSSERSFGKSRGEGLSSTK